jgi:hypothetical protein
MNNVNHEPRRATESHLNWPGWEGETEIRQVFGPEDYTLDGGGLTLRPQP